MSVRHVQRSITRLVKTGWLLRKRARTPSGSVANHYELMAAHMPQIAEMMAAARRAKPNVKQGDRATRQGRYSPCDTTKESPEHIQEEHIQEKHVQRGAQVRAPDWLKNRLLSETGSTFDELLARYRAKQASQ